MGYFNHYSKWHNHKDPQYVEYMKKKFSRIFEGYLPVSKDAAILEIGCSNGMALITLRDMGYNNILGIELDQELVSITRKLDLVVKNENAMEYVKLTDKKFDFIYMFDVLEHFDVSEIPNFLENLYRILNDNGVLLIITPNATSPAGSYFRYIDWTHETSFTPTSISYLVEEAGFKKILITDESLIEKPRRIDYEYEESFISDQERSDRARFYESFARWEMTSMFGSDTYNLLVTPNMKVVACKCNLEKIDLQVVPSSDGIFDFYNWVEQVEDYNQKFIEFERKMLKHSENKLNELNENISCIEFSIEKGEENIELLSFDYLLVKNQLEKLQEEVAQVILDKEKRNNIILSIFKKSMIKKHRSLWWRIYFKIKSPKFINIVKNSELFDEEYYLENYSDVALSGMSPIYHYLVYGAYEGRNPSEHFDTDKFILDNPEILLYNINPLIYKIEKIKNPR
ncbi:class I SAM-dependent methyltransferase [Paenibacillus motobuensis]|uniref:Methyltransferase type 11 domain-containing protein n=1 Tax=Paenibacillus motobuensis TaxID=295324 RepID=A0ABN0Y053_9BACL